MYRETVLLSSAPRPVTPPPDLQCVISDRIDGPVGSMQSTRVVVLSFLHKGQPHSAFSISPEEAESLGAALKKAAKA